MKLDRRGRLRWFALCYDPLEATLYRLRDDVSAFDGSERRLPKSYPDSVT
jgi:hypothetical protein